MSNQPQSSFDLNSQNYSLLIQNSGIQPNPQKNILVDHRTGKKLTPMTYGQLVQNLGPNVAAKTPPSFPEQKFVSMSDLVGQNVQPVLSKKTVQVSQQLGQIMFSLPSGQNFIASEETVENNDPDTFDVQAQNVSVSRNDGYDDYNLSQADTVLLDTQNDDLDGGLFDLDNHSNNEARHPDDNDLSRGSNEEKYDNVDETENFGVDDETSTVNGILHKAAASVIELSQDEHLHENCCRMCRRENRLLMQKVEALNQMLKEALDLLKQERSGDKEKQSETDKKEDTDDSVEMEVLMNLPVKTHEELVEFSTKIQSDGKLRRILTTELQDFKVKDDSAKTIHRMMGYLITDQCADGVVWTQPRGGSPKPTVCDMYIMKYVTWVIKKMFPGDEDVNNDLIEKFLMNWITRSSDRLRNAAKKKSSKKRTKQAPVERAAEGEKEKSDEDFE
ncbi:hypothetical protein QAD02_023436 [Eretmocerus hayati]|uniref:Uncharacterized protein n=1 Tax=Eretmocerus hayati TaxID=131215 RepID=A0ACC2PZ72_9HYME|nr:hypothetical protein QAD02_023436 [Eretmocerus hayati]